jgi:hypothetical protein
MQNIKRIDTTRCNAMHIKQYKAKQRKVTQQLNAMQHKAIHVIARRWKATTIQSDKRQRRKTISKNRMSTAKRPKLVRKESNVSSVCGLGSTSSTLISQRRAELTRAFHCGSSYGAATGENVLARLTPLLQISQPRPIFR